MATQTITLSGIASAESFGTLIVRGGAQLVVLRGIPSEERFGFLTVAQAGYQPFRLYRAGVYRQRVLAGSVTITERLGGGSTSKYVEQWPAGSTPDTPICGQEIKMTEGGRIEFLGNIDTFDTDVVNDRMNQPHIHWTISCRDLSARLDARTVTQDYEAGSAKNIIQDIVSSFLDGENITSNGVTTTGTIQSAISFKGDSVRAAIQRICDQTSDVFGVDYNRDLYCFLPGTGTQAPISLTDTSNNVRARMFTVTRSNTGKINSLNTVTGSNLG